MLIQVGELAKRAGMTVRTLHHYEQTGLLTPSARSEAGYRLYNLSAVQRLHMIKALNRGQVIEPIARLASGRRR